MLASPHPRVAPSRVWSVLCPHILPSAFLLLFGVCFAPRSVSGDRSADRSIGRMSKVQAYMNWPDFVVKDGGGLDALAK